MLVKLRALLRLSPKVTPYVLYLPTVRQALALRARRKARLTPRRPLF